MGRKLNFEIATAIRIAVAMGNSNKEVARAFEIHESAVSLIKNYHWWKVKK